MFIEANANHAQLSKGVLGVSDRVEALSVMRRLQQLEGNGLGGRGPGAVRLAHAVFFLGLLVSTSGAAGEAM